MTFEQLKDLYRLILICSNINYSTNLYNTCSICYFFPFP